MHTVPASLVDPDGALGIVWADVDLVGTVEEGVPLRPVLGDVPVAINSQKEIPVALVLPARLGLPALISPHHNQDPIRGVRPSPGGGPPGPGRVVVRCGLPPPGYDVVGAAPIVSALGGRPKSADGCFAFARRHPNRDDQGHTQADTLQLHVSSQGA